MTEFVTRTIHPSAVLFKFKELQDYFARTGEKVHLVCYPHTEEIKLETAFPCYKGYRESKYRINMFEKSINSINSDILQYICDNYLLNKVNNDNLIFWYGMTAGDLEQYITLEDFLKALSEYKLNGMSSLNGPSILDKYLDTETKELVAA